MTNPLRTLEDYELFLYTLAEPCQKKSDFNGLMGKR